MAKKHPNEWKLRCSPCTLNGASCHYRHYPLPSLEDALKCRYPTDNGKIRPFKPCYGDGSGKTCYTKPANLPTPKDRSPKRVPGAATEESGKGKSAADLRAAIAKHKEIKPKCCAATINTGKCEKENCPDAKHHKKTKADYDAQIERWRKALASLEGKLKAAQ